MIERACNMTDNSYYTIRYSNSGNKMSRYRIPGTDKFVSSKSLRKELDKIGMDYNEYFYEYIFNLPKDESGNFIMPKCQNPECNNDLALNGRGFGRYCCNECSHKGQAYKMSSLYKDSNSVFNSTEYRDKLSKGLKLSWANPNSGHHDIEMNSKRIEKIKKTCNNHEFIKKQSDDQINRWKDPEYRKIHTEINREIAQRPETRAKHSIIHKDKWSDPNSVFNSAEYRNKLSIGVSRGLNTEKSKINRRLTDSTPEVHERRSRAASKLWENEEFVSNQMTNNPFYYMNKKSSSKVSTELFDKIYEELKLRGYELDLRYGQGSEYLIHTGKLRGDVKSSRLLDFYIYELNKWIEFNGDYWHRNPRWMRKGCDALKFANAWINDRSRIKILSKILGTKPLIVWEMDYRRNPELIINKCVDFILGTSRL